MIHPDAFSAITSPNPPVVQSETNTGKVGEIVERILGNMRKLEGAYVSATTGLVEQSLPMPDLLRLFEAFRRQDDEYIEKVVGPFRDIAKIKVLCERLQIGYMKRVQQEPSTAWVHQMFQSPFTGSMVYVTGLMAALTDPMIRVAHPGLRSLSPVVLDVLHWRRSNIQGINAEFKSEKDIERTMISISQLAPVIVLDRGNHRYVMADGNHRMALISFIAIQARLTDLKYPALALDYQDVMNYFGDPMYRAQMTTVDDPAGWNGPSQHE